MSWPLMRDNITREDLDAVIRFLSGDQPVLTQSKQVELFEQEWSSWLGVRHSVLVNSGSSANLITLAALRHRAGPGEVIVPTLTWVSDVAAVLQCGMTPVFVDIDPRTLGMDNEQVIERLGPRTRAVCTRTCSPGRRPRPRRSSRSRTSPPTTRSTGCGRSSATRSMT